MLESETCDQFPRGAATPLNICVCVCLYICVCIHIYRCVCVCVNLPAINIGCHSFPQTRYHFITIATLHLYRALIGQHAVLSRWPPCCCPGPSTHRTWPSSPVSYVLCLVHSDKPSIHPRCSARVSEILWPFYALWVGCSCRIKVSCLYCCTYNL